MCCFVGTAEDVSGYLASTAPLLPFAYFVVWWWPRLLSWSFGSVCSSILCYPLPKENKGIKETCKVNLVKEMSRTNKYWIHDTTTSPMTFEYLWTTRRIHLNRANLISTAIYGVSKAFDIAGVFTRPIADSTGSSW